MSIQQGDVKINGKWYRIDVESYRDRDIIDFSPKASTPGGSIIHSELMLYQPLLQSDWRHGFGFIDYTDPAGYMKTVGNIDTRHDGVVIMSTAKTSSDTGDFPKIGGMTHKNVPYFWGQNGIRKYVGGAWSTETPNPVTTCTTLLGNVGFETAGGGGADVFGSWTETAGSGAIAIETGSVHGDTNAAKLTCGASDDTKIQQNFVSVVGTIYTLKYWTRGASAHAGRHQIYDVTNAADIVATATTGVTGDTYTQVTVTFTATSVSTGVIFKPGATSGYIAYFDDITMTSTTQPTANTQLMFSLGTDMFAVPYMDRIMTTTYAGQIISQPNETTGQDAYINENAATTSYGTANILKVGYVASKKNAFWVKPDLTDLPSGATITEVKVSFYCSSKHATANPTIKASRCLIAASESMTWNKYDGVSNWPGSAGGSTSGTDYAATPLNAGLEMTSTAKQFFTMTLDPTEFTSLVASNNGILFWNTTVVADNQVEFYSASGPNYDQRPYFTIKYTLPTSWADTGTDETAEDFNWAVVYNGFIYLGVRNTNRVHYSSSTTLADLEGSTADTTHILVGGSSYPTLGAINFLGGLYIAKPDGLWLLGEDKIAKRVLDFSSEASDRNFSSLVEYNGNLIFTIRDVVYQWNLARLTRMSPPRITDEWPYVSYGSFSNLVAVGDFLYCTARTNESTYTESILSYDGVGWHKLQDVITDGTGTISMLFYDTINNYMWLHVTSDTAETTYYIPFQERSKYPYSNFPTTGTHSLYSSKMDMGFARVTKSTPSLLVEAYNLSTTRYLTVNYSLDDGEFIEWGRVFIDGITELKLPGGLLTREFKRIQLRIDFVTGTATQTPVLESTTLRFLMRPDMALGWNFNVILADHFIYGEMEDARTAYQILKDMREARNSKAPIEYVDIDGGVYQAYVSAFSRSVQERNVDLEEGGVPSIESVLNVNIVEAK